MSMRDKIAEIVADAECSDDRGHGSGVLNSDAVADAIIAALDTDALVRAALEAADWMSVCAQTTGGTAGKDESLVLAIQRYAEAMAEIKAKAGWL